MRENIAGLWYLTGAQADEQVTPKHRVVIQFDVVAGELYGTVVSTSREIPLGDLTFDGSRLSFKLQRAAEVGLQTVTIMPYPLVLEAVAGEKFEGHWMQSETEGVGPKLKLWRVHEPDGWRKRFWRF